MPKSECCVITICALKKINQMAMADTVNGEETHSFIHSSLSTYDVPGTFLNAQKCIKQTLMVMKLIL